MDLHGFAPTERKNVVDWNREFNQICVRKRLVDQIGVVDINRRVDGKFRNTLAIGGHCPIITTANCQLLTMRQTGSTCTAINGLGRMLGSDDIAAIQGVKWSSVQGLQSRRQLHISFGNMFPVNLAGVVLREVFDKWSIYEGRLMGTVFRVRNPLTVSPQAMLKAAAAQRNASKTKETKKTDKTKKGKRHQA